MTRRLLLVSAATLAWRTGGFAQEAPKPGTDPNAGEDAAVVEVMLKDLLTWSDSPLGGSRRQIYLSPEAISDKRPKVSDFLSLRRNRSEWRKLSTEQLRLAQEATEDVARRSAEKVNFKDLGLKDRRIVLWDKTREDAKRAHPRVFSAYPPGYSQDRQLAIVVVYYPFGMHYGFGTCALSKKGSEWSVLIRDFNYLR